MCRCRAWKAAVKAEATTSERCVVNLRCRLLPARKARPRRTRPSSGNPLRTLQEQGLTVDEYVEVRTNVAERELKRIKHEQSTSTHSVDHQLCELETSVNGMFLHHHTLVWRGT